MDSNPLSFTVADHELLKRISRGSYGEVWLARNQLGTYRAVKLVQQMRFDTSRPFEREYEGIKRFEPVSRIHEGLVDILQVGRIASDVFYYVMEVADDQLTGQKIDAETYHPRTLASELQSKGPLSPELCVEIGVQLCSTLAFLHERDLIHRDIKPSNVIFVDDKPKLADVGLVADLRDARTYVGTTGFIPPEGPNSAQADIFGLGKLLYEISTGKDRNEFPALPDQSRFGQLFLELNEVLLKACHTDKARRYESAAAMAADLKLIAAGKSVHRLHVLEARLKKMWRVGAVLAAGLLLVGGASYVVNQQRQLVREENARLIGSKVAEGTALLKQGDLLASLPPLVDALRLDQANPKTRDTHRLRIGSILAGCPSIRQTWHLPERPVRNCALFDHWALASVHLQYCQVFDAGTGQPASGRLAVGTEPETAQFTPDGKAIVVGTRDHFVRIFDWRTGLVLFEAAQPQPVLYASISANGQTILTACQDKMAYVWDRKSKAVFELAGHADLLRCARLSANGELAITTSHDSTARVWNLRTRTQQFELPHRSWVFSADISPDGRYAATGSYDGEVKLWDLRSGLEIEPPLLHGGAVYGVQFSPDGSVVLTACLDGSARLWDRKTHQLAKANPTLHHSTKLLDACFSPDGHQILTAGIDGSMTLWDFSRLPLGPKCLGKPKPSASNSRISPDSLWEARTNGLALGLWRRGQARPLEVQLRAPPSLVGFNGQSSRFFALEGTNVCLVELGEQKVRHLPHPRVVTHAQFSPNGLKLVCCSTDRSLDEMTAQIRSAEDGSPIGGPLEHQDGVVYAEFSPDNQCVVTASEDASAIIWSATSAKPLTPKMVHADKVYYAAFAQTHPWLATASEDGTAVVWDSKTGEPLTPPFKHSRAVRRAEFIQGDTALLTTDEEGVQWQWPLTIETRSIDELSKLAATLAGLKTP